MGKSLKLAVLGIVILTHTMVCQAEGPRLRYGVQWGYNALALRACQYTYLTDIGYRVSEGEDLHADYFTNAFVSADLGLEFLNSLALTARAGYRGVAKGYRVFPAELQLSWFTKGYEGSSPFLFAVGGLALTESLGFDDNINVVAAGFGYRHKLSHKISLDGFVRTNYISCSPLPIDEYDGVIARERTIYSRATNMSIDFGIGLYF